MPMYDYECDNCGTIFERYAGIDDTTLKCDCGGDARRIISVTGQYTANEDAPWIRTVLEVVNKDDPAPHVQEFVHNPTRTNYKRWMKGEGIVPVDYTEKGGPPEYKRPERKLDNRQIADAMMKALQKHRAISIAP